jgi:hypothetical protein
MATRTVTGLLRAISTGLNTGSSLGQASPFRRETRPYSLAKIRYMDKP